MMFCGHCMMDVPEQAKFCLKCGTKLGEMTCGACGVILPRGSWFCMECGARLGENGEQLFKVTLERKVGNYKEHASYRFTLDQEKQYLLENGAVLELHLSEGIHEFEVSFADKYRMKQDLLIDRNMRILLTWESAGFARYHFKIV